MHSLTVIFLCLAFYSSNGQQIAMPDLLAIASMEPDPLDAFLKDKGYKLSQSDSAQHTVNRYYTAWENKDSANGMIRSLTWTKATVNNYEGVLVLYRTYDPEEQENFLEYVRANDYKLSSTYKTGNTENFLYSKEKLTIRNSITINRLQDNRELRSYSFETGR